MPHSNVNTQQQQRAKQLRVEMTRAETLLWRYIRAHRIDGLGFRRQAPIKNYIADFVCHSARLVIELDGESHAFLERQRLDARRDAFFASQGYRVLRFLNEDVLSNLEGVVQAIRIAAAELGVPPSLALPHKGGGNAPVAAATAEHPTSPRSPVVGDRAETAS
jgi:very-short-patch-repair endonuclease